MKASIILANSRKKDLEPIDVTCHVDAGLMHLSISENLRRQLGLDEVDRREVTLADGSRRSVPYVGPVEIRFGNRLGFSGALVMGDQTLLGAIPMEDMDLVIIPRKRQLAVNPDSPNMGPSIAK